MPFLHESRTKLRGGLGMNSVNSIHWRLTRPRYRLIGALCKQCGQAVFPPRPQCPNCAEVSRDETVAVRQDEVTAISYSLQLRTYT